MSINLLDKIKRVGKKVMAVGLITASTFYSCNKDDSMEIYIEPESESLKKETKILNQNDLNSISNLDDSKIYFSQPRDYLVGDIIAGGISEKTPYGILEKITNVSSDKKSFGITDTSLSEAINEGEFLLNKKLTINDLENKINSKIIKSKNSDYEFSYPIDKVVYDMDGNLETIGDQIRMSGEVLFNMEIELDLKFNKGLKYFNFEIVNEVESNLELKCGDKNIINNINEKKILYDEYFTPIVIPTPIGFPLVIVPNIEIKAGIEGELNGEVNSNIGTKLNLKNKLVYEFSEWNKNTESNVEFYYDAQNSYLKTDIKGYIEPKLNLLIYGGPGPFASIENYLKLNIDLKSNPWLKLDGGIKARAGVDMGIFDELIPNYEKVIWEFEKRVVELEGQMEEIIWDEDFESYAIDNFPNNWVQDANALDISTNKIIDENGNKVLQLYGINGGCWGSLTYHDMKINSSYELSFSIKNGEENNSGCHQGRGSIGLRKGTSWGNESNNFCYFKEDGKLYSSNNSLIVQTKNGEWQDIKIRYLTEGYRKLVYYLNGEKIHEEPAGISSSLNNLELVAQEGTVWFDNIKVKKIN